MPRTSLLESYSMTTDCRLSLRKCLPHDVKVIAHEVDAHVQAITLNHARAGSGELSAPLDYGTTARQMLSTAGFVEPVGCREVFNFDAASLRDPEAAEAQVLLMCRALNLRWLDGRSAMPCSPCTPHFTKKAELCRCGDMRRRLRHSEAASPVPCRFQPSMMTWTTSLHLRPSAEVARRVAWATARLRSAQTRTVPRPAGWMV